MRRHLFLAFILAATVTSPAFAADGQILITHAKVGAGSITPGDDPGYPARLTRPGSYILGSNLTPGPGVDGIDVAATDITIDLNGFTISGGAAGGTSNGRYAILDRADRLTVKNGTIGAFRDLGGTGGAGIYAPNRPYLIVENMRILNSGIGIESDGGSFTRIQDSTVATNKGKGIRCHTACEVSGSVVSGNGDDGIWCANACLIEGNVVSHNQSDGVVIYNSGSVLGNTIVSNTSYGLLSLGKAGMGNNTFIGNGGLAYSAGTIPLHPNAVAP
jgi:hypothetical protein